MDTQELNMEDSQNTLVRSVPQTDRVENYINRIQHLPPTPSLMLKLLDEFRRPDPDIAEVAQLISRDPALSAEVLKRCNSAAITGEQPVADMFEAISRLGFYEVYCMVGMISGSRVMALQSATSVVLVERLSRHSTITALAAAIIAKRVDEPMVAAFTAGLLHDIGKIIFASAEGTKYLKLLENAGARNETDSHAERSVFGFNHSEIGARLLNRWTLPQDVVNAVFFHNNLEAAGNSRRLSATVALASAIAKGENMDLNDPNSQSGANAAAVLSLDSESIAEIMEALQEELASRRN
jgi:putative nucleotidyltransferase with HDIG domain